MASTFEQPLLLTYAAQRSYHNSGQGEEEADPR